MDELYIHLSKNKAIIYKKSETNFISLKVYGENEIQIDDIESILDLKDYLVKTYLDFNEETHNLTIKIIYDYTVNRQILGNFVSIFSKKVSKDFYLEEKILHRIEAINEEDLEKLNLFLNKDNVKDSGEKESESKLEEISTYENKIENLELEIKKLKKINRELRISMIEMEKNYKLKLIK